MVGRAWISDAAVMGSAADRAKRRGKGNPADRYRAADIGSWRKDRSAEIGWRAARAYRDGVAAIETERSTSVESQATWMPPAQCFQVASSAAKLEKQTLFKLPWLR
jgi:hypothetical protein